VGELCVRGPQVMKGYWQRPDETAKVLTADGWLHTGDMAKMDANGFFYIVDRKKDMILVSGFNVYPNEIEDVIAQMPGVLEVAAVGVPDDKSGEAVKVVVVKKDPALTSDDVKAHCRTNLTGYKQPRFVEFRTDLPKIQRRQDPAARATGLGEDDRVKIRARSGSRDGYAKGAEERRKQERKGTEVDSDDLAELARIQFMTFSLRSFLISLRPLRIRLLIFA
jgi:hypothetical protein